MTEQEIEIIADRIVRTKLGNIVERLDSYIALFMNRMHDSGPEDVLAAVRDALKAEI